MKELFVIYSIDKNAYWSENHQKFMKIQWATHYDSKIYASTILYLEIKIPQGTYQILPILIK